MTTNAPPATWRPVKCPCGRSTLLELDGAAPIKIRRRCQRCGGWWIVDGMTGRVRGYDRVSEPDPVGANGRVR